MIKQDIKQCLRENYLPYAVSSIVDRAIVSIDGFKPSHLKLLYTMYKMGLLTKSRTKSANIAGQTMKLNPHSDVSIYETMVRMTKDNESLLIPLVDSKGNFGKVYSRDMAYAASRYTEAKLMPIAEELFKGIDKNAVDMIDNYDGTTKEPVLLPVTFPAILANSNQGIAVGIASNICSFNLSELCDYTIDCLKGIEVKDLIPDFSTGGELVYDESVISDINNNGRGSIKLNAKYKYDKINNCIEIYEIPYTTTVEAIIDKIEELVKTNRVKEISDVRDETDLKGLKLTIDLKRGVDADTFMKKLFKLTPLQDSFSCNFNVLIEGKPKLLGVKSIIEEWIKFRKACLKRELEYDIKKCQEEENELLGFKIVLLNIDKAISIIRNSETDKEAIDTLMKELQLNQAQAEYVAEIKLRFLNKNYLLKKIERLDHIQKELSVMKKNVSSDDYYTQTIINQLTDVKKKYGQPRKTTISKSSDTISNDVLIEDYNCTVVMTKEYIKKNIRYLEKQRTKDGDEVISVIPCSNKDRLLAFTDTGQCFVINVWEIQQCLPSELGEFIKTKYDLKDESIVSIVKYEEGKSITIITKEGKCLVLNQDLLLGRKKQAIKLGNSYDGNGVIYAKEYAEKLTITTNKKTIEYDINYTYFSGNPNNTGKFTINCRKSKTIIIEISK